MAIMNQNLKCHKFKVACHNIQYFYDGLTVYL